MPLSIKRKSKNVPLMTKKVDSLSPQKRKVYVPSDESLSKKVKLQAPELESVFTEARRLPKTRSGWCVETALRHLCSVDERFCSVIAEHGIPRTFAALGDADYGGKWGTIRTPFSALVKTIVFQQLAGAAADPIHKRLLSALGVAEGKCVSPQQLSDAQWEVAYVDGKKKIKCNNVISGLSEAKMRALQSLTEHFMDPERLGGGIDLATLSPNELRRRLLAVKGLGPWSVNMFQIFELHHADVYPEGDLGVRRGTQRFYNLSEKDDKAGLERLRELTACWGPYASLGSCYMWKVHDAYKGVKNSV